MSVFKNNMDSIYYKNMSKKVIFNDINIDLETLNSQNYDITTLNNSIDSSVDEHNNTINYKSSSEGIDGIDYCSICNYCPSFKADLKKHFSSKKHINNANKNENNTDWIKNMKFTINYNTVTELIDTNINLFKNEFNKWKLRVDSRLKSIDKYENLISTRINKIETYMSDTDHIIEKLSNNTSNNTIKLDNYYKLAEITDTKLTTRCDKLQNSAYELNSNINQRLDQIDDKIKHINEKIDIILKSEKSSLLIESRFKKTLEEIEFDYREKLKNIDIKYQQYYCNKI